VLHHKTGCRSHNTGCDGDCDCRSFVELNDALDRITSAAQPSGDDAVREEDLEPMDYCSQCGWSGRSFHACEGVPGGFSDD
jgi:hypothetical protein